MGLEDIKKLNGLGSTFRRKVNRDFSKAFVGTSGIGTQQNLMQQAISGYALFDLVEPTYNLDYLSKIYEMKERYGLGASVDRLIAALKW